MSLAPLAHLAPLPSHALVGTTKFRRYMTACLKAEIKHWSAACHVVAALRGVPSHEAERDGLPYRLPHEVAAQVAWDWLSALNMHHNDMKCDWVWPHLNDDQRKDWRAQRRRLMAGFLKAARAYQVERDKIDAPVARAA